MNSSNDQSVDPSIVDIAIVGGGIVGLSLAAALQHSALRVVLLDASDPAPSGVDTDPLPYSPRVSALTPTSLSFLESLGVGESLQNAADFSAMTVWDGDGTGRVHYDARSVHRDRLGVIMENPSLVAALRAALDGGAVRQCQDSLQAMSQRQDAEGRQYHQLELASGDTLCTRLVVGADGGRSRVRELAALPVREWSYGQDAIVTTLQMEKPHQATAWQVFLPEGPLALLPLQDKEGLSHCVSLVWSCTLERRDALMAMDAPAFGQALTRATEYCLGQVQVLNTRFSFPLQQRHAVDYVAPGVALVGDAAHTIHPLAGQGVNLGLSDARVLAEVVLDAQRRRRDFAHVQTLSAYARRRKGQNLLMMGAMEGFKRLFCGNDLLLRSLRNVGLNCVDHSEAAKRLIMRRAMGL